MLRNNLRMFYALCVGFILAVTLIVFINLMITGYFYLPLADGTFFVINTQGATTHAYILHM